MKSSPVTRIPSDEPLRRGAFTLIELMIVVGVIGLIAVIGIPAIYHATHPGSLSEAVNDMKDACAKARSRAIWGSATVELRINPRNGSYQVVDVPKDAAPVDPTASPPAGAVSGAVPETTADSDKPKSGISGQLSDRVRIDMLDVNFRECKDDEEARVRFYSNGTCDEFTIVLHSFESGESRKITLELVTAMPEVTPFP